MTTQPISQAVRRERTVATPQEAARPSAATRLHFIDKLRMILIVLVIAHHAGQAYGPTGGAWFIPASETSAILGPFFSVNAMFFMGLLFLIAGYFTPRSVDRKGAAQFLKGRFIRLGIPTLFFALFVLGPLVYLMRPEGTSFMEVVRYLYQTGWQALYGHLWFLGHLLLYSVAYVLWRQIAPSKEGQSWPETRLPTHATILAFVVALTLVTFIVRIWYPIDRWAPLLFVVPAEFAHLPQYVSLFALGVMAARGDWLRRMPTATGMVWLTVGLIAAVAYYVYNLGGIGFLPSITAIGGWDWRSLVYSAWEALVCAGLSVGLLVLCREWLNTESGTLFSALAAAAFGAYIIHLFIVIGIQAGLAAVALSPLAKFALVTVIATMLSFGIAHLARQVPLLKKVL